MFRCLPYSFSLWSKSSSSLQIIHSLVPIACTKSLNTAAKWQLDGGKQEWLCLLNTSVMIFPSFKERETSRLVAVFPWETVHLMLGGWSNWGQSVNGWRCSLSRRMANPHHRTAISPDICTVPAGGEVTVMTVEELVNIVVDVVGSHGGASVRSSINYIYINKM